MDIFLIAGLVFVTAASVAGILFGFFGAILNGVFVTTLFVVLALRHKRRNP